jgi:5-methylcytosine-specific restriction endonuclease McrA
MSTIHVLKLNAAYMPLEIIGWKKAISLVVRGRAEILEKYDEKLDTFKGAYQYPSIIRLLYFVAPKKDMIFAKPFTRKNILERDLGRCCFCDKVLSLNKMTYDHVIPKCEPYNGKTCFTNIVSCCLSCNSKKKNRLPEEAGMKLLRKPYIPIISDNFIKYKKESLKTFAKLILSNKQWLNYIYWNIELDQDKS